MAGSLEKGVSFDEKIDKNYTPRKSGQGQRPTPPKGEKVGGKFTLK